MKRSLFVKLHRAFGWKRKLFVKLHRAFGRKRNLFVKLHRAFGWKRNLFVKFHRASGWKRRLYVISFVRKIPINSYPKRIPIKAVYASKKTPPKRLGRSFVFSKQAEASVAPQCIAETVGTVSSAAALNTGVDVGIDQLPAFLSGNHGRLTSMSANEFG